jgi:hypothetical protein
VGLEVRANTSRRPSEWTPDRKQSRRRAVRYPRFAPSQTRLAAQVPECSTGVGVNAATVGAGGVGDWERLEHTMIGVTSGINCSVLPPVALVLVRVIGLGSACAAYILDSTTGLAPQPHRQTVTSACAPAESSAARLVCVDEPLFRRHGQVDPRVMSGAAADGDRHRTSGGTQATDVTGDLIAGCVEHR